ncbi:TrkA family potassium uptake protein, partial [Pseudomonas sp. 2995-3]|uniref:potassium channel family protein n=1 Tax=Pseudomonas sp. 2995-3 TaxID=1712680 RepID=UPI00117A0EC6
KNSYHHKVLEKIGADKVVHPETDTGRRIAQQLSDENVIDFIELSDEYSIVELLASSKLEGKSLIDLNIRARYGITILAIKKGDNIDISPSPNYKISNKDLLI